MVKPASVPDGSVVPVDSMPQPWLTLPLVPETSVTILLEAGTCHIPLFLAAPIQGTADPLLQVAQDLDRPVYGLQYPPNLPHQSITEVAQALVQVSILFELPLKLLVQFIQTYI